ncbi:hypothetical protein GCM10010300_76950 [Streptomyces olivaceoviridis]|uniref:hypothetical protein n=1 Tax=Streptomyces olivaceoviridis TaxID=1921 RepID=UPI00167BF4E5|nr:hypothetical protein [Streptomyces olivaceoviridis]GGZ21849.1 hypothetical protein GCM10010300_76950 [Streptomyces olivaceoviridis]
MSPSTCPKCGARLGPSRVHGEGPWNRSWRAGLTDTQQWVPRSGLEADVVTPDGIVVELQYGSLAKVHIEQRERIYGDMVWLFDARQAHKSGRLQFRFTTPGQPHINFKWCSPRSLDACHRPVYLDLGDSDQAESRHLVLKINRRYPARGQLLGSGLLHTATAFHNWMAHGIPLTPYIPPAHPARTDDDADAAA